jgi:hypothetical protein
MSTEAINEPPCNPTNTTTPIIIDLEPLIALQNEFNLTTSS